MNRWMSILAILIGLALLVAAAWLDVRDGVPTMKRGDQPWEVVVAGGLGIVALGNGIRWLWRGSRRKKSERRDGADELSGGPDA